MQTLEKLGQVNVLGANAVERRKRAVQHMIKPPVSAGAFHGYQIAGFLNYANLVVVALGVGADGARGSVGQVAALVAEYDAVLDGDDRVGEGARFLNRGVGDVVGDALGAFGADAGKPVQFVNQPSEGTGSAGAGVGKHSVHAPGPGAVRAMRGRAGRVTSFLRQLRRRRRNHRFRAGAPSAA